MECCFIGNDKIDIPYGETENYFFNSKTNF